MKQDKIILRFTSACTFLFCLYAYSKEPIGVIQSNSQRQSLNVNMLEGRWTRVDSPAIMIEMVDSMYNFILKSNGEILYYFSSDSLGNVSSSGYFPMWPPLNCDLEILSNDTLKVMYSRFGPDSVSYYFIRLRE